MIDVSVDIFGITIYCDESILGVEIGNGYSFEKVYLDALPHRDKLIDDLKNLKVLFRKNPIYMNKESMSISAKQYVALPGINKEKPSNTGNIELTKIPMPFC